MDKLQELTDKLYNEGLSKGKAEGEQILEAARKEAEHIISEARKSAVSIMEQAEKDAADFKLKVTSDVKMAAAQSIQATKKDVENLVMNKLVGENVAKALSSADFMKEFIKSVAERFSSDDASDLNLILPASLQAQLEPFVQNELSNMLGRGISADFSKKIAGGFTIGPKNGGYFISLTDATFDDLISEYLRPVTRKLLFG